MSRIFNHSLLKNIYKSQCLSTFKKSAGSGIQCRNYLTPAYQCMDAWNSRLDEDLVKMVGKPGDFLISMLQKKKTDYVLYAHDVDVYFHSLATDGSNWSPDDVEELLLMLRPTNETLRMLDSTPHVVLRLLLQNNCTQALFRILSQPELYGVYLDDHATNLMMDHYLLKEDYTNCARVASHLMLAEMFGNSLNQEFALLSCLQYATHLDTAGEWLDYVYSEPEPEDDVKVRVDFVKNPYFDDHYDLREGPLLAGKTLAWCSERCLTVGPTRTNCLLVGWAMFRKWNKLQGVIDNIKAGKEDATVSSTAVSVAREHITSHCGEPDTMEPLLAALDSLAVDQQYHLIPALEEHLTKLIHDDENKHVQAMEQMYKEHAEVRLTALQKMKEEVDRRDLMAEITAKKQHLKKRRQLLYYFNNEKRLDFFFTRVNNFKHPFPKNVTSKYHKLKKNSLAGDNYVPPTPLGKVNKAPLDPNFESSQWNGRLRGV